MVTSVSLFEQETGWSLAAHWHRCQNLPKKRVNTLLLYRERDDPVKDGVTNWRTRSRAPRVGRGKILSFWCGHGHPRQHRQISLYQISSPLYHTRFPFPSHSHYTERSIDSSHSRTSGASRWPIASSAAKLLCPSRRASSKRPCKASAAAKPY